MNYYKLYSTVTVLKYHLNAKSQKVVVALALSLPFKAEPQPTVHDSCGLI